MALTVAIPAAIWLMASALLLVSTILTARLLLANRRPLVFALVLVAAVGVLGSVLAVTHTTLKRHCQATAQASAAALPAITVPCWRQALLQALGSTAEWSDVTRSAPACITPNTAPPSPTESLPTA